METLKDLEKVAVSNFLPILRASNANNCGFKSLIMTTVDGERKPLLLVGSAHGAVEDGRVIGVLNPDRELCDEIKPLCGYTPSILKEIVAKRCDAMVNIGVSAYKKNPIDYMTTYQARKPQKAKFLV